MQSAAGKGFKSQVQDGLVSILQILLIVQRKWLAIFEPQLSAVCKHKES